MVETRNLTDSVSFGPTADTWAKARGILDTNGNVTGAYPVIIGMPSGSTDLGAFNLGIIQSNRTIKQALQDLETTVNTRMLASNNLSDLTDKVAARTALQLGSASTWNVGTSGAVVPLLSGVNTYSALQTFNSGISSSNAASIFSNAGTAGLFSFTTTTKARWSLGKDASTESGSNAGGNFVINRYDDTGALIDSPLSISRATGVVTLSNPLPVASGGTGSNSLSTLKNALGFGNVDNTSDVNKPISTAVATALAGKFDKLGGNVGSTTVNGYLSAIGNYVKSNTALICDGVTGRGGVLILAYPGVSSLTGIANGAWVMDVNTTNALRIYRQGLDGSTNQNVFYITEAGVLTIASLLISGSGLLGKYSNITGSSGYFQYDQLSTSASTDGTIDHFYRNEKAVNIASQTVKVNKDGSSSISFQTTIAGDRNTERRVQALEIKGTSIDASLPINGNAYPRRQDGTNINFIWNATPGQPNGVLGSNDGVNFNTYNPSSFSVAYASNAGTLNNVGGGDAGGYIRRSSSPAANGSLSFQLILSGSDAQDAAASSPLVIREVNLVGSGNTSTTYAPAVTFQWNNVSIASIKLQNDGSFRFQTNTSSIGYVPIYASEHYSTGWFRPTIDTGIYWDGRGRGLTVADNGASYGHVNVYGSGLNGYGGYSVGTNITMMSNGSTHGLYSGQLGNWLVSFDTSGNAVFPNNVTAYSDERLKTNIRPIDNVNYRRQGMAKAAILYERDGLTRVGFGAQTLEAYVPEVVHTADDLMQTKSVNYQDLVAILAADNQQLADRIETLENHIASLSTTMNALIDRLG